MPQKPHLRREAYNTAAFFRRIRTADSRLAEAEAGTVSIRRVSRQYRPPVSPAQRSIAPAPTARSSMQAALRAIVGPLVSNGGTGQPIGIAWGGNSSPKVRRSMHRRGIRLYLQAGGH
jgi:hypothetical protein